MQTTETDAAEKWCPFVRRTDDDGGVFNRGYRSATNLEVNGGAFGCNCLGSACMMWRRSGNRLLDGSEPGYCGLAGVPNA